MMPSYSHATDPKSMINSTSKRPRPKSTCSNPYSYCPEREEEEEQQQQQQQQEEIGSSFSGNTNQNCNRSSNSSSSNSINTDLLLAIQSWNMEEEGQDNGESTPTTAARRKQHPYASSPVRVSSFRYNNSNTSFYKGNYSSRPSPITNRLLRNVTNNRGHKPKRSFSSRTTNNNNHQNFLSEPPPPTTIPSIATPPIIFEDKEEVEADKDEEEGENSTIVTATTVQESCSYATNTTASSSSSEDLERERAFLLQRLSEIDAQLFQFGCGVGVGSGSGVTSLWPPKNVGSKDTAEDDCSTTISSTRGEGDELLSSSSSSYNMHLLPPPPPPSTTTTLLYYHPEHKEEDDEDDDDDDDELLTAETPTTTPTATPKATPTSTPTASPHESFQKEETQKKQDPPQDPPQELSPLQLASSTQDPPPGMIQLKEEEWFATADAIRDISYALGLLGEDDASSDADLNDLVVCVRNLVTVVSRRVPRLEEFCHTICDATLLTTVSSLSSKTTTTTLLTSPTRMQQAIQVLHSCVQRMRETAATLEKHPNGNRSNGKEQSENDLSHLCQIVCDHVVSRTASSSVLKKDQETQVVEAIVYKIDQGTQTDAVDDCVVGEEKDTPASAVVAHKVMTRTSNSECTKRLQHQKRQWDNGNDDKRKDEEQQQHADNATPVRLKSLTSSSSSLSLSLSSLPQSTLDSTTTTTTTTTEATITRVPNHNDAAVAAASTKEMQLPKEPPCPKKVVDASGAGGFWGFLKAESPPRQTRNHS